MVYKNWTILVGKMYFLPYTFTEILHCLPISLGLANASLAMNVSGAVHYFFAFTTIHYTVSFFFKANPAKQFLSNHFYIREQNIFDLNCRNICITYRHQLAIL